VLLEWEVKYKGHTIRVEASNFWRRLFINDRQVARHPAPWGSLRAPIPQGAAAGEVVHARLGYRLPFGRMRCAITVNNRPVLAEDRFWMARWLAWFLTVWVVYGLLTLLYKLLAGD